MLFLKARVALPLFFERALIEITPRRVLYWADGDAASAPVVTELERVLDRLELLRVPGLVVAAA